MRGPGHPLLTILVATLAISVLLSAGPAAAAEINPRNAQEPNLVSRINDIRAAHGLRRLRVAPRLTSAATRHANSMGKIGYFRHELRRNGTWKAFGTWIGWYWPGPGFGSWSAGENLAWGAPDLTPARTATMWMNSTGHRANILGRWRWIGVSIVHVTAPRGYYRDYPQVTIATAEFGRRS
jgi:uncharacterized protein YkwD